jgi:hypothetical protein
VCVHYNLFVDARDHQVLFHQETEQHIRIVDRQASKQCPARSTIAGTTDRSYTQQQEQQPIMSSNRQSGIFNNDDDDGFGFEEALKIVGMVMVLVILLLCLRFGCNIAIDLCVLCNPYEARRTVIDLRDRLFPFFKRRLVNPGDDVEQAEGGDRQQEQQESARTPSRPEEPTVESLLRGLSAEERQQVIDTVFQGKVRSTCVHVYTQLSQASHQYMIASIVELACSHSSQQNNNYSSSRNEIWRNGGIPNSMLKTWRRSTTQTVPRMILEETFGQWEASVLTSMA